MSSGFRDYVVPVCAELGIAADRLVEKANEAGGRDNITVVVVDVLEGDDPPDPTQELDVVPVWAEAGTDPTPAGTLELDPDAIAARGHRYERLDQLAMEHLMGVKA